MKKRKAFAQIPLMIGLLLMAVAVPVATKLVQQNQTNQGKATSCGTGTKSFYYGQSCCDGYEAKNCSGSGTYVTCDCVKKVTNPTVTPATKSCKVCTWNSAKTKCNCVTTTDNASNKACPSSNCTATDPTAKPTAETSSSGGCTSGTCKYGVSDCVAVGYAKGSGTCSGGVCCGAAITSTVAPTLTGGYTACTSAQVGDVRCVSGSTTGAREQCKSPTNNVYRWESTLVSSCGAGLCSNGACITPTTSPLVNNCNAGDSCTTMLGCTNGTTYNFGDCYVSKYQKGYCCTKTVVPTVAPGETCKGTHSGTCYSPAVRSKYNCTNYAVGEFADCPNEYGAGSYYCCKTLVALTPTATPTPDVGNWKFWATGCGDGTTEAIKRICDADCATWGSYGGVVGIFLTYNSCRDRCLSVVTAHCASVTVAPTPTLASRKCTTGESCKSSCSTASEVQTTLYGSCTYSTANDPPYNDTTHYGVCCAPKPTGTSCVVGTSDRCSSNGNNIERCVSSVWQTQESCIYGCASGKCKPNPLTTAIPTSSTASLKCYCNGNCGDRDCVLSSDRTGSYTRYCSATSDNNYCSGAPTVKPTSTASTTTVVPVTTSGGNNNSTTATATPTKTPSDGGSTCKPFASVTANLNHFSIWRSEYITGSYGTVTRSTWNADFDCDNKVTLNDYSIWRTNYIKSL